MSAGEVVDQPRCGSRPADPWFAAPVHVAVPAHRVFTDKLAPAVEPRPVEPLYDLCRLDAQALGLDATWTDLIAFAVELAWPGSGIRATLRFGAAAAFVVAASPRR